MLNPFAIRGATPMERMVRSLALVGVIVLVIWAFWTNNQRVVARLNLEKSFWDETGLMTEADADFVREFLRGMKTELGRKAYVHVRLGEPVPPDLEPGDLYLGISPSRQEVVVRLPEDMDPDQARTLAGYLADEHFKGNWEQWERGLKTGLVMVWERLTKDVPAAAVSRFVEDDAGLLTREQVLALDRFGSDLADTYGQKLLVRLAPDYGAPEDPDPVVLYIGLWPEQGGAALRFPALFERALGPDLARELLVQVLEPGLADGDWFVGLKAALERIWAELGGEERTW